MSSKLKVLLLGGGGREHALAWKLSQSPLLEKLWVAPGNPGIASIAQCVALNPESPHDVVALAKERSVDLVVVGPEAPLVAGVADALGQAGIAVFGPVAGAARLEGSKAFAKEVMAAARVPTAAFETFTDPGAAAAHARRVGAIVVKADGLAAGKGVVVARDAQEAVAAVESLAGLGAAGAQLVLEEVLEGEEVSVIALCDGERAVLLPPAQDHKRVGEGDRGPNTGGMGAYAPVRGFGPEQLAQVEAQVILPVLRELKHRGLTFRGALYAGLMLTPHGPKVLEFNCRFGDPEAQVLMLQLGEDLLPLLHACATGTLTPRPLRSAPGVTVGVVMAAAGYPGHVRTGDIITGLDTLPAEVQVFQAGTRAEGTTVSTSGGRVLCVCARAGSVAQARSLAYQGVSRIHFAGAHFRRDIAARGLEP